MRAKRLDNLCATGDRVHARQREIIFDAGHTSMVSSLEWFRQHAKSRRNEQECHLYDRVRKIMGV